MPSPDPSSRASAAEVFDALQQVGVDAVAFQGLESAMSWWRDVPEPEGTGAIVAYTDTGRSWIAAGRPLVATHLVQPAAERFAEAARAAGRHAAFFCVEDLTAFPTFRHMRIGLQSELEPAQWPATLRRSRHLREQVRRARAKGVRVRRVHPGELTEGSPLRAELERLARTWLATRAMEPMGFLVSVELFHQPDAHIYLIAERPAPVGRGTAVGRGFSHAGHEGQKAAAGQAAGVGQGFSPAGHAGQEAAVGQEPAVGRGFSPTMQVVQCLSAVPIPGRRGWLLEDMLRAPDAPNGTTELILDQFFREVGEQADVVTPGLTPLAGDVPWWLRASAIIMRPLYDFEGLRRFRARLSPQRWAPVWLVWDRGPAVLMLLDLFRAFARGRLVRFAWRSLTQHPNGPPWAVAVPLVPWTFWLAGLVVTQRTDVLGYSRAALTAWVCFDVWLCVSLFRAARRPRANVLTALGLAAAADAAVSVAHLWSTGLDHGILIPLARVAATIGPIVGACALGYAAWRARVRQRHPSCN
jgi:phosphatidylglycerol lysyltransferase